ncbi:MAG: hypothetical protein COZ37_05650 [bacterium (Candidatus Ratteibacteria) CG_4_10_14_3_um_filter_41_18]|uniref:Uncharacterized protein n=2 Tax=Candidatus Ratteibacteria TaxID=2979319 RepID=A0A2M7E9J9_9BACT|nr:MAG: hypothetical protein COS11_02570 [bacterium (Candidatus Ratteibacteria) CG01_land_8_20_14_3_00_40_19]PIX76872.1 MAG: hypothetical protein COZ37_05650 [bacterium (Candidatus Ratteibacteria) CG_4_10_14_3_um_filter_41_18]
MIFIVITRQSGYSLLRKISFFTLFSGRTFIEEERNERYVMTAGEAENLGYRRAWKWRGQETDK